MALARYEGTAVNTAGDVIPNATVEVRRDQPGRPIVPLWGDREGTVALGNPIQTNAQGGFAFHVVGGVYYIRIFTGPSQQPTFQKVLRYVGIGTAAERDVEDLASALETGTATFPTLPNLEAFTPSNTGVGGKVTTGESAGFYHYDTVEEEWVFDRPLYDSLARMNVTGGDENDIEAAVASGVDSASVVMLFIEPTATNTGPVTINGKSVLTTDDEEILPGRWVEGRTYWFSDEGTNYKLRTDSDVSDLVTRAEAAEAGAIAAQAAAEAAAAGAGVTDGNKGAITVSGAGASWTLNDLAQPENGFFVGTGGHMQRMNDRLFVGDATKHNGEDEIPQADWLTNYELAEGRAGGSLMYSTVGITNSDHPRSANTAMFGSQTDFLYEWYNGIAIRALAKNNSPHANVHAYAAYFEGYREAGRPGGAYALELDTMNYGDVVSIDPFQQMAGQTIGLQIAGGGEFPASGQFNLSAAINIRRNGASWVHGLTFGADSIAGTNGVDGGIGQAITMATGHAIDYYYAAGQTSWRLAAAVGADGDYNITTFGAGSVSVPALKETTGKAWTSYTPTVTTQSGAITTLTAAGAYRQLGKSIEIAIRITVTANGTGAAAVMATLPFTAGATSHVLAGRENNVTGKMLQGFIQNGTNQVKITNYDNTYPAADGTILMLSGVFQRN